MRARGGLGGCGAALLLALACAAALGACVRFERLELAASEEDLAIVAVAAPGGDVREVLRYPSSTAIALEDGDVVHSFIIRGSELVDPTGAPLGADLLGHATVRAAREPPAAGQGACGRCLGAFGSAPAVVHSGSSCLPPLFAEHQVGPAASALAGEPGSDDEERERVRAAIRVDWPGACACALPAPTGVRAALRVLRPSGTIAEVVAATEDGTAGLFARGRAVIVPPGGARVEAEAPELAGAVLAAVGLPQRGPEPAAFLVASEEGDARPDNTSWWIASAEGERVVIRPAILEGLPRPSDLRPARLRRIEDGAARHIFIAGSTGGASELASCTAGAGDRLSCAALLRGAPCAHGQDVITDVTRLEDGTLVAVSEQGRALSGPLLPGGAVDLSCPDASVRDLPIGTEGELARVYRFHSVGGLGARAFACGVIVVGPEAQLAVVTRNPDGEYSLAATFTEDGPFTCGGFAPADDWSSAHPESPRLRLSGGGLALDLDTSGRPVGRARPLSGLYPEVAAELIDEHDVGSGFRFARAGNPIDPTTVELYRRRAGGPHARIFGEERDGLAVPADGRPFSVLAARAGDVVAIRALAPGRPALVHVLTPHGGEPASIAELEVPDLASPSSARWLAAAADSRDGTVLLAGADGEAPILRRLDLESRTTREVQPGPITRGLIAAAELAPGRFVVADEGSRLFLVADEGVAELTVSGDDPFTAPVEPDPGPGTIAALAASGGILWAAGAGSTILRVRATPGALSARAERLSLDRYTPTPGDLFDPANVPFSAIDVTCPDRALLGAHSLHVEASGALGAGQASELALAPNDSIRLGLTGPSAAPVAFAGGGAEPAAIFADRRVIAGGARAPSVPFSPSAAVTLRGWTVIGGGSSALAEAR